MIYLNYKTFLILKRKVYSKKNLCQENYFFISFNINIDT